jgi:hypothetical protein
LLDDFKEMRQTTKDYCVETLSMRQVDNSPSFKTGPTYISLAMWDFMISLGDEHRTPRLTSG